jgi:hypothetical protein
MKLLIIIAALAGYVLWWERTGRSWEFNVYEDRWRVRRFGRATKP